MANPRTTGGIIGPGAKNVAPIYKPTQQGIMYQMGTNPKAPKAPSKKKGPSLVSKIKKVASQIHADMIQ
jgi:hypothetical protein